MFLLIFAVLPLTTGANLGAGSVLATSQAGWLLGRVMDLLISAFTIPLTGAVIATCYVDGTAREGNVDPSRLLSLMAENDTS